MRIRSFVASACLLALVIPASAVADSQRDEHARIADYWTSERMRNAKPKEQVRAAKARPGGSASFTAGPVSTSDPAYLSVGKVFFTEKGVNYVCSGTTVKAHNGGLDVWTAGHCVNEGPGAYVTNFAFVPGYYNGNAPMGKWTAASGALKTTDQWRTTGDFTYDLGVAHVTQTTGTGTPTVWTPTFGYTVNLGQTTFTSYGYPAAGKFNGQTMFFCTSPVQRWDGTAQVDPMAIGCDMTGGSSGGGWVNVSKQVVSVNSYGYQGLKNTMFGPYQGSVASSLYTSAP